MRQEWLCHNVAVSCRFGEGLDEEVLTKAQAALNSCDLFVTIGTSSVVYPAAGFAAKVVHSICTCPPSAPPPKPPQNGPHGLSSMHNLANMSCSTGFSRGLCAVCQWSKSRHMRRGDDLCSRLFLPSLRPPPLYWQTSDVSHAATHCSSAVPVSHAVGLRWPGV